MKQYNSFPAFHHYFEIFSRNNLSPPLIINSPRFVNGFDSGRLAVRPSGRRRQTESIYFHRNLAGLIYGSKSISA